MLSLSYWLGKFGTTGFDADKERNDCYGDGCISNGKSEQRGWGIRIDVVVVWIAWLDAYVQFVSYLVRIVWICKAAIFRIRVGLSLIRVGKRYVLHPPGLLILDRICFKDYTCRPIIFL